MTDSFRCRGMRDMTPDDMRRFRTIEQAFRDVCLGWGYEEVRTPTIEPLHLFTAAGTLSPQMLGRVYSFLDWDGWSGERVVLRPDSTIPAVRLFAEGGGGPPPARLFYVQNVFRFASGDESREDWQCGVELIGDTQPQGDVELVAMAMETLERLGLGASVKLSDPGILRRVLVKAGLSLAEQTELYDRVLDGDLAALDEVQARLPRPAPSLRGLLSVEGEGAEYLENLRVALAPAVEDVAQPIDELAAISRVLKEIGYPHRIQPLLVRDFEYYTGPVFHLFAGGRKIGGGGRYDALTSLIGGPAVPASGFALDVQALSGFLPDGLANGPEAVTVRTDAPDLAAAFALARELRRAGYRVEFSSAGRPSAHPAVVVEDGGFSLSDGAGTRRVATADEVVRALAEASGG